ncbi:MAG TPA: FecR family protein [Bacteroidales bacterium]|jgi:ferric-dicitrate binding protein FerR (iron transport regulator)|nr:FecR family protein [Bacteroidales bacterium]
MKKREKIMIKDWNDLASSFSGEKENQNGLNKDSDMSGLEKEWKKIGEMNKEEKIDVDKAWDNVYSRISTGETALPEKRNRFMSAGFLRIAAALLIIAGIGSLIIITNNSGPNKKITLTAAADQINMKIDLPDGSSVYLNRNSELNYTERFGKNNREVSLRGEAFFEVAPDKENPFIIKAGKANVTVVGTSFSVKTSNEASEVEVFVKTGKVLLSGTNEGNSILLDPGYIGKSSSSQLTKSVNTDPNYLAWNTGNLVYDGQKLETVFRDLKKFYNMEVVADDPSINQLPWTAPNLYYESQDKVILLICRSFNLSYSKVGNVYHLTVK